MYKGQPVTPGFRTIRQSGAAISFILFFRDKSAFGDAVSVQYAGSGGREEPLHGEISLYHILKHLNENLIHIEFTSFKAACIYFEQCSSHLPYFKAIAYGISQALLDAFAQHRFCSMAEIIKSEYGLQPKGPLPNILCQTDSHDISQIDRMILKGADIFPHANFNCQDRIGPDGSRFVQYVSAVREKIRSHSNNRISALHFDLYGTLGECFSYDINRIAMYLLELERLVSPYPLQIETPVLAENKTHQFALMSGLRETLRRHHSSIKLIVDEWCNTVQDVQEAISAQAADIIHIKTPDMGCLSHSIDAVLLCVNNGVGSYLGGSSNETEISAKATAQIAVALRPTQVLAKPCMGAEAGIMMIRNEMKRAELSLRKGGSV